MKGFLTCLQQGRAAQMWAGLMEWVPGPAAPDAKRYGKQAVPGSWREAKRLASQRVTDHKQAWMYNATCRSEHELIFRQQCSGMGALPF